MPQESGHLGMRQPNLQSPTTRTRLCPQLWGSAREWAIRFGLQPLCMVGVQKQTRASEGLVRAEPVKWTGHSPSSRTLQHRGTAFCEDVAAVKLDGLMSARPHGVLHLLQNLLGC